MVYPFLTFTLNFYSTSTWLWTYIEPSSPLIFCQRSPVMRLSRLWLVSLNANHLNTAITCHCIALHLISQWTEFHVNFFLPFLLLLPHFFPLPYTCKHSIQSHANSHQPCHWSTWASTLPLFVILFNGLFMQLNPMSTVQCNVLFYKKKLFLLDQRILPLYPFLVIFAPLFPL